MGESLIFGPNVILPSIPGLKSECEEEILQLMKEVNLEFQRRLRNLENEKTNLYSLCRAQSEEIEKMRCLLVSNNEAALKDKELIKISLAENEKLKKEANALKADNHSLQKEVQRLSQKNHYQENLRTSLSSQQEENKILKEKLIKATEEHKSLYHSYNELRNKLNAVRLNGIGPTSNKNDQSSSNYIETLISETTGKIVSEETERFKEFQSKIDQEIDTLQNQLSEILK